jgi:formate/nitrite transporter
MRIRVVEERRLAAGQEAPTAVRDLYAPHISGTELRIDPYGPAEMAGRAQAVGVAKARLDTLTLLTLGVLAGAFIALGAIFSTIASVDSTLGWGPTRLLAGVAFSLGLILVVIAGAELFTGNTLIVMAWLGRQVPTRLLLRNWGLAYVGNLLGALGTVGLVYFAGQWKLDGARVGASAVAIANAKVELSFAEAVARGILCNALVCLAVWLCFSARSNIDRIVAIVPPIAAFVAAGFEHSIANMYFIPLGILLKDKDGILAAGGPSADATGNLTWSGFLFDNLLPVTIGNLIGGGLLVGAVYWLVYLRGQRQASLPAASSGDGVTHSNA